MSFQSNFAGVKCLVTGAGRGIGRAITAELHKQGATVYALSKNPDNLKKLKEEFPRVIPICADLSSLEQIRNAVEPIEPIDCLINNAGACEPEYFLGISEENFEKQFNVNVRAVIFLSQIVVKKMIAAGNGGSIVNISSILSQRPMVDSVVDCCTKAALDMLTKSMALDLGAHKIRVNSVNPGMVPTDMLNQKSQKKVDPEEIKKRLQDMIDRTPTKALFMPMSEVVNATLFLASKNNSQITGHCLNLDGGYIVG